MLAHCALKCSDSTLFYTQSRHVYTLAQDVKTAILEDKFKVPPFNRANNIVYKHKIQSKNIYAKKL